MERKEKKMMTGGEKSGTRRNKEEQELIRR